MYGILESGLLACISRKSYKVCTVGYNMEEVTKKKLGSQVSRVAIPQNLTARAYPNINRK